MTPQVHCLLVLTVCLIPSPWGWAGLVDFLLRLGYDDYGFHLKAVPVITLLVEASCHVLSGPPGMVRNSDPETNDLWGTEACQEPQWVWKWVLQPQLNLELSAAPVDPWTAALWDTLSQRHPGMSLRDHWPTETVINACCFQPLSFVVIYYMVTGNEYKISWDPILPFLPLGTQRKSYKEPRCSCWPSQLSTCYQPELRLRTRHPANCQPFKLLQLRPQPLWNRDEPASLCPDEFLNHRITEQIKWLS